jgi:2-hydroxychromene-2-carboxylate isomerase
MGSGPHLRKFPDGLPLLHSHGATLAGAPFPTGKRGQMGDVIKLSERREALRRRGSARRRPRSKADFYFDLACPFTYLAAERVERVFDEVAWRPASTDALRRASLADDTVSAAAVRRAAEERAVALRLPLVWPERFPAAVPAAMRVASRAAEGGRGAAFVLAATRLAFCGGFDLDDPEILAEAAAAAGVALGDALRAAREAGRDGAIADAGRALFAAGADRLPALRVARALYWGEERVGEALVAARFARATAAR